MPLTLRESMFNITKKYKDVKVDGSKLICIVCEEKINYDLKHGSTRVKDHMESKKHKKNKELKLGKSQKSLIVESFKNAEELNDKETKFGIELVNAFMAANIPLNKLKNPVFKTFMETYMKRSIPSISTIRKCIDPLYDDSIELIRKKVDEHSVYFILDETTDKNYRNLLNILVAPLNGFQQKPMLLLSKYIDNTNNLTVSQEFNNACIKLWPNGVQYEKVLLAVTDQASYMVKAFENLKANLFSNLNHITCLAHSLNRVCDAIREKYSTANLFISSMKKILKKSNNRRQNFKNITKLSLPPIPVKTRWGAWLKSAFYYIDNFKQISEFISQLKDKTKAISDIKSIVKSKKLEEEFIAIHEFRFLPESIKELETRNLKMDEQMAIIESVRSKLNGFALHKLEESLKKNPDLIEFTKPNNFDQRLKRLYAPLEKVEAERSFSKFKQFLTDHRLNFTVENIEKINVIQFNSCIEIQ
jgi:hypothetical protein